MAQRISDHVKQEILDRTDLVGLVMESVPLKRAGNRFMGRCPFHKDKDPSFSVSPDKGFYYCFGCNEHGDAITFLMKSQGMTYVESLENLARRAGVRIPDEAPEHQKVRDSQYHLLEAATKFFEDTLQKPEGQTAREILGQRGLDESTQREFRIGFVPPGWDNLTGYLRKKGVSDAELVSAGIGVTGKNGNTYDRFRNRIIFPIQSVSGKVIAFGGRKIDPEDEPKYLNSPETDLFKKGYTLYALNVAKKEIQKTGSVCVVEGYMDAIALHQHGVRNAVATLGTALTPQHWSLVSRYAKDLYLVFDGDVAGRRATLRGIEVLLPEGALPLAVETPEGDDPDTFIRKKGKESFEAVLAEAKDPIEFWLDCHLEGKERLEREDRVIALREVTPIIALSKNPVRRSDWAARVAQRLGVRPEDVIEEVKSHRGKSGSVISLEDKILEVDPCTKAKEGLIALLLAGRNITSFLGEILDPPTGTDPRDEVLEGVIEMLAQSEKITVGSLTARFSPEAMSLIRRIEALEPIPENYVKAARDYVAMLRHDHIARSDTDDLLTSLDKVHQLHRERVSLGMGEGFRY